MTTRASCCRTNGLGSSATVFSKSIAHLFLPPAAHQVFRSTYGEIDEETWQLARFQALYHATTVAIYAKDAGKRQLEREAIVSLKFLASGAGCTS